MSLNNIKSKLRSERGFTIVELLIVIVVIGILAAITIVAYAGVVSRADATKAQTNAAAVQKVAEAFRADAANSGYPADADELSDYNGIAKVPTGVSVVAPGTTPITADNGRTTVSYLINTGETGGCIGWWDYSVGSSNLKFVFVGAATAGTSTTCT